MPIIIKPNQPGGGGSGTTTNIKNATINNKGELVFTMSDGTKTNAGQLMNQDTIKKIEDSIDKEHIKDGLLVDDDGNVKVNIKLKANDTTIDLKDGAFTLPVASKDSYGLVKISDDFTTDNDGKLEIKEVSVDKLVNSDTYELVIGGW